ncbi:MAG: hypothetical protein HY000_09870 [Planctomycetes bacterium]|nr:hypothetical protein [Planctomycetota bacterium]
MNTRTVVILGTIVVSGSLFAIPARPQQPSNVAVVMRIKLDHSQKVLEGIAIEDFLLIEKNARQLSLLSQAADWQVLQTPDYLQHSLDFRRSADALASAARNKNLDGAALAYVQMTMNCVNCHKYARSARMVRYDTDRSVPKF